MEETPLSPSYSFTKVSFTDSCQHKEDVLVNIEDSLTDFSVGDSSSPNTATDDEAKHWRAKYHDKEKACKCLQRENERINIDLAHERYKSNKLHKKLQFIRDHQEIFYKLKDAYMNMKYNEASGKRMTTIQEQSIQTYNGILCCNCVETEKLRKQLLLAKNMYATSVIMSKDDYSRMQDTLTLLQRTMGEREKSWSANIDRENQFKTRIIALTGENDVLRDLLKNRESEKELRKTESEELKRDKDMSMLKKIIVKYERKFRDKSNKHLSYPGLSEREKRAVEQLMSKFYNKLGKKIESRSMSCERELHSTSEISSYSSTRKLEKSLSDVRIENPIAILDLLLERGCK